MIGRCVLDGDPLVVEHMAGPAAQATYRLIEVDVPFGTRRIEVAYTWDPAATAVIDLGLRGPGGVFRGWSGSREGRIHEGQPPVFVEAGGASRGYLPGPVDDGVWQVELGHGDIPEGGVTWRIEVRCMSMARSAAGVHVDDPVDPGHVARDEPGWFHADLHMHGHHSHPEAPSWDEAVGLARQAGVEICAFTEYTTTAHWGELGPVQRANPDLVIWPAREIISYFGHAVAFGATPSTAEYRVGHEGITMADIQAASIADGALFGVAHPTAWPVEDWGHFCRGCEYRLWDQTDLAAVRTLEVVTVGAAVAGRANPFVRTAIDQWERLLRAGHRITAVAGSDDKLGRGYGSTTTVIGADRLSVGAVRDALVAGRAYVKARDVRESPTLHLEAWALDAEPVDAATANTSGRDGADPATFGSTIDAEHAEITITVTGAAGQVMAVRANGSPVADIAIVSADWTHRLVADRRPDEGPLGTFWTIETHDDVALTALANPVFVAGAAR